jgi:DNA helicase-2/ATP-dependent DNA helicase PcrA
MWKKRCSCSARPGSPCYLWLEKEEGFFVAFSEHLDYLLRPLTFERLGCIKNMPKLKITPKETLPDIVNAEQDLLNMVLSEMASSRKNEVIPDYDGDLLALRDAMNDEMLADDQAMLLEQMDRLAVLAEIHERSERMERKLDPGNPYFAHLHLDVDDDLGKRDILLGRKTFVRGRVRIVDWRNAPISQVFYRYRQGDLFAEEIADRQMEGQVLARRTVTIVDAKLVRISAPEGTYLRTQGGWRDVSDESSALSGGAGTATRPDTAVPLLGRPKGEYDVRADKHLPEIAALLDAEQFALLTQYGQSLLVVTGGAGSGKTTVGLHRLAFLAFDDPKRFRPRRMLTLVFGKALARFISKVLPALGVKGLPVDTLSEWAQSAKRRHFPELTRNVSESTPAVVLRFKTHRILVPMIEKAARKRPSMAPPKLFDELFTDKSWMIAGVEEFAPGSFSKEEIEQVYRWCTDQHSRRYDPGTLDDDDPACYDEEDAMILLRMHQLMRGRLSCRGRRKLSYDHIFIDEVQDFSPLELAVLLETAKDGSITLAGDPAQKITDNDFSDWSEVLNLLGMKKIQISPLKVSYRSTKSVVELAQAVLGPLAPKDPPRVSRDGLPVELIHFAGRGQAMTFLADALTDLTHREPKASVALLTRNARQAEDAYQVLRRGDLPGLSRVADQNFSFGPGIEITDIAQSKGLEFDYVVMLDVDRTNFPKTDSARHLLHVGTTRAIHQLWLLVWGTPSPLLPDWLQTRVGG